MTFAFGDARLPERFWAKVEPEPNTGCWLWAGTTAGKGYGGGTLGQRKFYAHRLAWERLVGAIPNALQLDHKCRVRCCCNPAHLEPVTCRVNLLRGETLTSAYAWRDRCAKGHPIDGMRNKKARLLAGKPAFRYCLTCNREDQRMRRKNESERTARQAV